MDLQKELELLRIEAANFALRFINDGAVRQQYIAKAKQFSDQLLNDVISGRKTSQAAAKAANAQRNNIMAAARARLSDFGLALSHSAKPQGILLNVLQEKYAMDLFKVSFDKLSSLQREQVWMTIIKKAGTTSRQWSTLASKTAVAGRGLLLFSLGVSVYNVTTAENKPKALGREVVTTGSGLLGGAGGGALAGLACGPGAPICIGIGIFLGGMLGSWGGGSLFSAVFGG